MTFELQVSKCNFI